MYEYFPDWFRSGSLNSPITQVSIKLDRFIPFKVLQLVCIRKTYPDAHLCMVKTTIPWHQQHSSASVVLRDNMLIKPANRAKRTWFTKVARVIYVTTTMVWLCPAGIKQKSPIQKKTVMSFHNYEKKVNRKTNKTRQVIDDPKKNIKCSGRTLKKKSSQKRRFIKNNNLRFR